VLLISSRKPQFSTDTFYIKKYLIFSLSYDKNLSSSIFYNDFNTQIYEIIYLFRIYYEYKKYRISRKNENFTALNPNFKT